MDAAISIHAVHELPTNSPLQLSMVRTRDLTESPDPVAREIMPHSILKEALSSIPNTSPSPARSRENRNQETALYHAQLLQQRKDVEALILASTEALLELPSSSAADPALPGLQDIKLVKNSLKPFQPSDYDSLIEERNINKQCGYVLCPRPNRQEDTKAKYRILHGKGRGSDRLKFVERHTLERWCSDDCGKRALYVKVQLNEEPAWTRAGSSGGDILLLEDERNNQKQLDDDSNLIEKLRSLDMGLEEDEVMARMKALAIERGDGKAPSRSFGLAEIDVRENRNINGKASVPDPSVKERNSDGGSDSIEGYTPKSSRKKTREPESDDNEDEDMMPTI
ncbi:hypothetical protein HO133_010127 [Letharia lupina]|uniref:RNA polymerase II subunit B1 CTD phosphatase RPAP2 homolog n=1 Tax=Letharia lupina TaxID=560253 RepID=A0A8H6CK43_9LECA|nr:uncharacterized protein HO133_010127 [Letharia lupina]KAF6224933.1 hypothetical protein HO133_010127 [Letharia lupina]